MSLLRRWSKGSVPKCILAVAAAFGINIAVFTVLWRLYILIFADNVPATLSAWSIYIYVAPAMLLFAAADIAVEKPESKTALSRPRELLCPLGAAAAIALIMLIPLRTVEISSAALWVACAAAMAFIMYLIFDASEKSASKNK